jgi:hypothetical protein
MNHFRLLLLFIAISSPLVAQQIDDIYENLETRSRFRILQVYSYSDIHKLNTAYLKTRPSRLSYRKAALKAKYAADTAEIRINYRMYRESELHGIENRLRMSEEHIAELMRSDTNSSSVKALIEDARTRAEQYKYLSTRIDSIMTGYQIDIELKNAERKFTSVDSESMSATDAEDAICRYNDSTLKRNETYLVLSTPDFSDRAISSIYVPFSVIKKNRLYKKIN